MIISRFTSRLIRWFTVFTFFLLAACGDVTDVATIKLTAIQVTPTNLTLPVGVNQQFIATGIYSDNSHKDITAEVSWNSTDQSIATITPDGIVSAISAGLVNISASLDGISSYDSGESGILNVTAATLVSISVLPTNPVTVLGLDVNFTATGTYTDNSTQDITTQVTWASTDTGIATTSNAAGTEGEATPVAVGSTVISASLSGISSDDTSESSTLTVSDAELVSIAVTPTNPTTPLGVGQSFSATGTFTDATTQDITTQVTWDSANTGIATISNVGGSEGEATPVAIGSTVISASVNGISSNDSAESSTLTVTAAELVSIAVTPANSSTPLGVNQSFTATGTYTDATTQDITTQVTWASTNTGIAAISNAAGTEGEATPVAVGSTVISASLSGISSNDSGESSSLTVTAAELVSIAVTPSNPSTALGVNVNFIATGTYTDASTQNITTQVTWDSTNTGIATISNAGGSEGVATPVAVGSTLISASLGGISSNDSAESSTLTVTAAELVSIAVTPSNPSTPLGVNVSFIATGTYTDASTQNITTQVAWNSSAIAIASISNAAGTEGETTPVTAGITVISASLSGISSNDTAESSTLTVTAAALVSIAVSPSSPTTPLGINQSFIAMGTYTDASTQDITTQVTWASNNTGIASISNAAGTEGEATPVAVGSTVISASLSGISSNDTAESSTLTVTAAELVSIAVTPASTTTALGVNQSFIATGTYTDASTQNITTQVTWASTSTGIASISNAAGTEGEATPVAVGSAVISASLGGISSNDSGESGTLTVTAAALVSIAVSPGNPNTALGVNVNFSATGTYTDASTQDITTQVMWVSTNTGTATISNAAGTEGEATPVAVGSTVISASLGGISSNDSAESSTLTVTSAELVSIAVTPTNPSTPLGVNVSFLATGTYTDATTQDITTQVTWASTNTGIASISNAGGSEGEATPVAVGSTVISASFSGISSNDTAESSTLSVTAAALVSIAVSPSSPTTPLGINQSFIATGTYTDASTQNITTQVTWASTSTGIASISNAAGTQGEATPVTAGSTVISASLSGISSDDSAESATLTVTAAALVSIAVTPSSPTTPLGIKQSFIATGTYTDASTQNITTQVTWASTNTGIAIISNAGGSEGEATPVAVGSTVISASLSGINSNDSAESGTLMVTAAELVSIAVTPSNTSTPLGVNVSFIASGTYTDASTQDITTQVTWFSGTTATATISNAAGSEGNATPVAVGSTLISASLGGISSNDSAESSTLTVSAAALVSIAVTSSSASTALGINQSFTAMGTYSDATTQDITTQVTWASANTGIAIISNSAGNEGEATPVAVGSTVISASLSSVSSNDSAESGTLMVTAAELVSIAVSPGNPITALGVNINFTATGTYTDTSSQNITTQVTWASTNTVIATISNAAGTQGEAAPVAIGSTVISASLGAISSNDSAESGTLTVTAATLASISVTPASPTTPLGVNQSFIATGTYTDTSRQDITTQVTWDSTNTGIATISNAAGSEGETTPVAVGSTTISASFAGVSSNDSAESSTLTVTAAELVSIVVTPTNPSTALGVNVDFTATAVYTDASTQDITTQVTWASTDTGIATISNAAGRQGETTTVAVGNTVISASFGGVSSNDSAESSTLTVTAAELVSIAVSPSSLSTPLGVNVNFIATGTYTDASTQDITTQVAWASTNTGITTISNAAGSGGEATPVAVGGTVISASLSGVSSDDSGESSTLTVTVAELVSIAVTPINPSTPLGVDVNFIATGTYTDASTQLITTQVTWASTDTGIATISSAAGTQGEATPVAVGSTVISASLGGISSNDTADSSTLTVTVAELVSIAVSPGNPSTALGVNVNFSATGTYTDASTQDITTQVTWASTSTGIATISNAAGTQGEATPVVVGSSVISASLGGISSDDSAESSVLTVTVAELVSIAVTPTNPSTPLGVNVNFIATGTYTDASTQDITTLVTWASTDIGIASISNAAGTQGEATPVAVGGTVISASLGGINSNDSAESSTLTVTVAELASIAVTPTNPSIALGVNINFLATGTYTDASTQDITTQVAWSSTSTGIATISNAAGTEGEATPVAVGSTVISASLGGISSNDSAESGTLTVTVAELVSIAVTPINPSTPLGVDVNFIATGTYTDASTQDITTLVTWASTSTGIATISNAAGTQGEATPVAVGSTVISASLGGISSNDSAESGTLTVTVAELVSIAVSPASPSTALGVNVNFIATGTYTDASTQDITTQVIWDSANTGIATISNSVGTQGESTPVALGSTVISASLGGISSNDSAESSTLTVTAAELVSIAVSPEQPIHSVRCEC